MKELEARKKYKVKSDNGRIDFDYEVLEIKNNKVVYRVLEDRTKLPFLNYIGIKISEYHPKSQFVKNSEKIENKEDI